MTLRSSRLLLFVGAGLMACGPDGPRSEFQGPPGSGEPNLSLSASGAVTLTWLEPVLGTRAHALRFSTRSNGGWSAPATIIESDSLFVNWADFPSSVTLPNGSRIVHWLAKVPGGKYGYHVRLATQGAASVWGPVITPHRDTSPQEHGFVSMAAIDDSTAGVIWLDGRAMQAADPSHESEGNMTLRFRSVTGSGRLGAETLLDDRTCECCQTALVRTRAGLVAAYRDRSATEIRDIAVVRYVNGTWTVPAIVAADNWEYRGCPVNGPALAARHDTVAIAWFAAPGGKARVMTALSFDGGTTWKAPLRIDDGQPLGRVDIEMVPGGAVVVWLEAGARAAVRARRVTFDGVAQRSWQVAPSSEARASGFPRVLLVNDELVYAWTSEQGIRVAAQPVRD